MSEIYWLVRSQFYGEACRLADKHEVPPHARGEFLVHACQALAYQAWRREIEPWLKAKADVLALKMPQYTMTSAYTLIAQPPELTEQERRLFDEIDELIGAAARSYSLEWQGAEARKDLK